MILDALESDLLVTDASLKGMTVISADGQRQGVTAKSVDDLCARVLPWLNHEDSIDSSGAPLKRKADAWEKMYGNKK